MTKTVALHQQMRIALPGKNNYSSFDLSKALFGVAPRLEVRFDSDTQGGKLYPLTYTLQSRPSPDQSCSTAKQYAFVYDGALKRFIDLKAGN